MIICNLQKKIYLRVSLSQKTNSSKRTRLAFSKKRRRRDFIKMKRMKQKFLKDKAWERAKYNLKVKKTRIWKERVKEKDTTKISERRKCKNRKTKNLKLERRSKPLLIVVRQRSELKVFQTQTSFTEMMILARMIRVFTETLSSPQIMLSNALLLNGLDLKTTKTVMTRERIIISSLIS